MGRKTTVLVVDDEDICVFVASKMLENLGMEVIVAKDGVEAVTLFGEMSEQIACVLMDIQMPRMNGIEAFRRLRTIRKDVKVVIASGYVNTTNKTLIDPLDPVGYIQKPLSMENLSFFMKKAIAN